VTADGSSWHKRQRRFVFGYKEETGIPLRMVEIAEFVKRSLGHSLIANSVLNGASLQTP
jgi:hypothetical protein